MGLWHVYYEDGAVVVGRARRGLMAPVPPCRFPGVPAGRAGCGPVARASSVRFLHVPAGRVRSRLTAPAPRAGPWTSQPAMRCRR
ncbi:hypothetical protein GCM10010103_11040 [Streptomyces paradoxus]